MGEAVDAGGGVGDGEDRGGRVELAEGGRDEVVRGEDADEKSHL